MRARREDMKIFSRLEGMKFFRGEGNAGQDAFACVPFAELR
jgi:hypothetical protein